MDCAGRLALRPNTVAHIVNRKIKDYIFGESWLTKQERRVFQAVLALLLVGWAVKNYRTAHPAHPPTVTVEQAKK